MYFFSPSPLHAPTRRVCPIAPLLALLLALGSCTVGAATQPSSDAAPVGAPKSGAKIYKYMRGGTVSFSDVPPSKGAYVVYRPSCFACNLNSSVDWYSTRLHLQEYGDEITLAARQFALDPALVRAVIHAESDFNANARSPKGAMGLMQLMPGTARMVGVADARIAGDNIRGGVQYLAGLMARFKNDVSLAAAAYNAGPEAVQKYAGIPPYAETQVYVQRVKILMRRYQDSVHS